MPPKPKPKSDPKPAPLRRRDRFGKFNPRGQFKSVKGNLKKLTKTDRRNLQKTKEKQKRKTPTRKRRGALLRAAAQRPARAPVVSRGRRAPQREAPTRRAPKREAVKRRAQRGEAPPVAPSAEPVSVRVSKPSGRRGAVFFTYFKAMGTIGTIRDLKAVDSPSLLEDDLDDFAAPAAWYSNQSSLLGQVKFRGQVELAVLIDRLNNALQFAGEERPDFDFRTAYPRWSYRYRVIESIGPTDRVIASVSRRR